MDRGAWWATIQRSQRVRHDWSNLACKRAQLGLREVKLLDHHHRAIYHPLNIHWKDWYWSWSSSTLVPNANSQHIGKDPDAGKDWKQKEKRASEDEMVGWHHRCSGHELGQTPGDGGGQGGMACCSPWDHKEWETTWGLNNIYHLYWSQRLCSSTLYMLIPLKFLNGNLVEWTLSETL